MWICHKPFPYQLIAIWKCCYYFFYWKCRFEMAVTCLILQETPYKLSMQNFHFWVQDQKLWNGLLQFSHLVEIWVQDQKLWNGPLQFSHLVEMLEIVLLHVLSNGICKCAINLFPISWEPFENVKLLFFLLKMQIWNGCNALNIAGNPIKYINEKLSFLSSGSKVVEWSPQFSHLVEILEIVLLHVLSNDACKCAINLFPSAESHLKMLIYYFFY